MADIYAQIDKSILLQYLFYPRRQHGKSPAGSYDLKVPVTEDIDIVCRAYPAKEDHHWLLYFHGNGEVVSDYDGIAPLFNSRGINLIVADYRGYGASGGSPTFQNLVGDALKIFDYSLNLHGNNDKTKWFVMGRSLGSISALEIAHRCCDILNGVIIESGFLSVSRLINHLGLPAAGDLSLLENSYRNLAAEITAPALIIHGEQDRLVPLSQGKELFDALGSPQKELLVMPGADHNDIFFVDTKRYMEAIELFIEKEGGS